jgi:Raf kinase inhibitor-like YbhB/YbcL family protein
MNDQHRPPIPYVFMAAVPSFDVWSHDMRDGEPLAPAQLLNGRGLDGGNLSPHLRWAGFPGQTRGFGVTCLDVDALTGSGFWHWVLFNLPASVTELPAGAGSAAMTALPAGAIQARNDFGTRDYCGAAPPKGRAPHRYVFAVHALDTGVLSADADSSPAYVGSALREHTVARALIVPVYQRDQEPAGGLKEQAAEHLQDRQRGTSDAR